MTQNQALGFGLGDLVGPCPCCRVSFSGHNKFPSRSHCPSPSSVRIDLGNINSPSDGVFFFGPVCQASWAVRLWAVKVVDPGVEAGRHTCLLACLSARTPHLMFLGANTEAIVFYRTHPDAFSALGAPGSLDVVRAMLSSFAEYTD